MQTATIFIDESGASAADRFWGIGCLRARQPDMLRASVEEIRRKTDFRKSRFHFSEQRRSSRYVYRELVQEVQRQEGLEFHGLVVDKRKSDPAERFRRGEWDVKANLVALLLSWNIKPGEQVTVLIDRMPPPPHGTFERVVLGQLRERMGRQPATTVLQLDSHTCDGLQVADILTSAMMHEVRQLNGQASKTNHKAGLVQDIKDAWNLSSLCDVQSRRYSATVYRDPRPRQTEITFREQ